MVEERGVVLIADGIGLAWAGIGDYSGGSRDYGSAPRVLAHWAGSLAMPHALLFMIWANAVPQRRVHYASGGYVCATGGCRRRAAAGTTVHQTG